MEESQKWCSILLERVPHHITGLILKCQNLEKLGKYEEALQTSKVVLSLSPQHTEVLLIQSQLYQHLDKKSEARAILEQISATRPDLETMLFVGKELVKLAGFSKAVLCYDRALQRFPNNSELFFRRGECLFLWFEHQNRTTVRGKNSISASLEFEIDRYPDKLQEAFRSFEDCIKSTKEERYFFPSTIYKVFILFFQFKRYEAGQLLEILEPSALSLQVQEILGKTNLANYSELITWLKNKSIHIQ